MAACITCVINTVIWPLPPAIFTYRRQHLDVVDGAMSPIKLVFHHLLHVATRLLGPIHPQQPIQKVGNIIFHSFIHFTNVSWLNRPQTQHIQHTTAITALSPHLRDVRRAGHNQGATDNRGDLQGALFVGPCHAPTNPPEPPHYTEPQSTTASHRNWPQVPRHTKHDTPSLHHWPRDTAHGPTAPMAPDTPCHPTRLPPQHL
jgi:hypothetical protein